MVYQPGFAVIVCIRYLLNLSGLQPQIFTLASFPAYMFYLGMLPMSLHSGTRYYLRTSPFMTGNIIANDLVKTVKVFESINSELVLLSLLLKFHWPKQVT